MIKQTTKKWAAHASAPLSMAAHHPRVFLCISPCLGFGVILVPSYWVASEFKTHTSGNN